MKWVQNITTLENWNVFKFYMNYFVKQNCYHSSEIVVAAVAAVLSLFFALCQIPSGKRLIARSIYCEMKTLNIDRERKSSLGIKRAFLFFLLIYQHTHQPFPKTLFFPFLFFCEHQNKQI